MKKKSFILQQSKTVFSPKNNPLQQTKQTRSWWLQEIYIYIYDEKSETKKQNENFVKGRISSWKFGDLQIMYTYQYFQLKYY
jgi:hypothetical protein